MDELIPFVDRKALAGAVYHLRCACGEEWDSEHKLVAVDSRKLVSVARIPCPRCGFATHVRQATSDWEPMEL
jgi:hypothetical protein